jgi:hypothetical protein
MTSCKGLFMIPVTCLAVFSTSSHASAQDNLRDRVAAAVETIGGACASDISNFCGKVTRGEGRVLVCMQSHEDQLNRRCQFALYRASRGLEHVLNRVERIADACWNDIQTHCGESDKVGQCVVQKKESLAQSCQTVVAAIQQALQGLTELRGMPVYSSDNRDLGQVVEIVRGPDGKIQSVQVQVGRFLGLGNRVVTINADAVEQLSDRIRVRMAGDQVRSLPEERR